MNEEMLADIDRLIKFNPNTLKKLHALGYDDPEYIERALKELEGSENEALCLF